MTETSAVGVPAYGSYLPTTHNVPAFLLPRLAEMATEVPNTNTGRGIYYERGRPGWQEMKQRARFRAASLSTEESIPCSLIPTT
jgi:hypothetical protein